MTRILSEEFTAPTFDLTGPGVGSSLSVARAEFWKGIPALVDSKVRLAQEKGAEAHPPVIEYLRDLEIIARSECESRETVQIIASGRRLLGDKTEIAPGNGPFSRT